jgi:hypothetical protein
MQWVLNHRGSHVPVAEQCLDRPDIVIGLQKMGGKAVAEGMRSDALRKFSPAYSLVKRILDMGLVMFFTTSSWEVSSGTIVFGRGTVRSFFSFPWTVSIPASKLKSFTRSCRHSNN